MIPIKGATDNAGYLVDPFSERETPVHSGVVLGIEHGYKVYEHCKLCGAIWSGKWKEQKQSEITLACYDGGRVVYQEKDGRALQFQCVCLAAKRNFNMLPKTPPWLWRLHAQQGAPSIVRRGEAITEIVSGPIAGELDDDAGNESEPPYNPLLPF